MVSMRGKIDITGGTGFSLRPEMIFEQRRDSALVIPVGLSRYIKILPGYFDDLHTYAVIQTIHTSTQQA